MNRWKVCVKRIDRVTWLQTVEVEANNRDEAIAKAWIEADDIGDWGSDGMETGEVEFDSCTDLGPVVEVEAKGPSSSGVSQCQNCCEKFDDQELKPVKRLFERVSPGEPMPSGECPDCGALCQPCKPGDSQGV